MQQFQRVIDSLTAALAPASARQYRAVARCFLVYLGEQHPAVGSLNQLRRDPHVLGWFVDLRSQNLTPAVYIARLLLMRHTGMRIGECVDLAYDCLHNAGPDRWAIHVPLGKLKTERMVPIDSFVRQIVHRLRFFRSFDPLPFDGRLLARPRHKQTLVKQLRSYLPDVVAAVGIPTRIVPHQLRHTYASEMVRAGVGLPALMKLLGHVNPEMTMRYVDVAGSDLQREFHLARSQPRHLAPQPKAPSFSPRGGLDGVIDSLLFAQHTIEMFRRSLPDGAPKHRLDQLANRLTKILAETRKLNPLDRGQRLAA